MGALTAIKKTKKQKTKVYRAYDTSRPYRELKLRGALVHDGKLKTLPDEEIMETFHGVWNLSANQGNLGTFFITTVRLVWFAELAHSFNVSIPYLKIIDVKTKTSKFGKALVISTCETEGGYHLGFRMDPDEKLDQANEVITNLHSLFSNQPNFGVRVTYEEAPGALEQVTENRVEEDVGVVDDYTEYIPASFVTKRDAYVTHQETTSSSEPTDDDKEGKSAGQDKMKPQYNVDLGCAVQRLPGKVTPASLWALMS